MPQFNGKVAKVNDGIRGLLIIYVCVAQSNRQQKKNIKKSSS